MKHYVKVIHNGRTIADAFIEAPTPSGALKLGMAGHGLDLSKVKPDERYTIHCGDTLGSAYGDEFATVAEYAGDDVPRHEDGAFLRPRPEESCGRTLEDCKHKFDNSEDFYGAHPTFIQEAIRRTQEQLAAQEEAFVKHQIASGGIQLDFDALSRSLGVPADLLGIQPITASRRPVMPQLGQIQMELEFDFECDCGHVERHTTKMVESPNMIYYTSVRCSACGKDHPMRIER